ncbi:hypothetical protein OIE66_03435 [Nonomuraea sp. NBC_01738]|uniref:hypothetical protein n=1 Tax=Nonomuraea sp. NBC_01738 TaxID=2976003 RepID=UPI002E163784|nr:hypothetical protein OIE66_03435 [Nonomuraea sp. NBC_01738]
MVDQFDVIETGGNGRRRWIGVAVVLGLLVVPVAGFLLSRDPDPEVVLPPSGTIASLSTITSAPNMLHATSRAKGDDEIIDVVFPDGEEAEVRYPAELQLDDLGSRPFQGSWVEGDQFGAYRALTTPYGGDYEITRGAKPLRNFTPTVTLWPRPPGSGVGQVLLFEFGPWRVAMYDRPEGLRFEQRLAVAKGLHGKVTKDGYLVLSSDKSIRLAVPGDGPRGDPVGPQLWFGGGSGDMLALVPMPDCRLPQIPSAMEARGRAARARCQGDMLIAASGSRRFVEQAVEGIRVRLK